MRRVLSLGTMSRRTVVLCASACAAATAGAVIASAAIPDTAQVIHACYGKVGGVVRVVDTEKGESCLKLETPITWNQRGPQGPAGDPGPQGAKGEKGDPRATAVPDELPAGETLRGAWAVHIPAGAQTGRTLISFAFPPSTPPLVHLVQLGQQVWGCPGTAGDPQADPGHFCLYEAVLAPTAPTAQLLSDGFFDPVSGRVGDYAGRFGIGVAYRNNMPGSDATASGTWAVTAGPDPRPGTP